MWNFREAQQLKKLRNQWPIQPTLDGVDDFADVLYRTTVNDETDVNIDDKTWRDLDMMSIFHSMDVTQTSIGQQYLYRSLRILSESVGELRDRHRVAAKIMGDSRLREQIQLNLTTLGRGGAGLVTKGLFGDQELTSLPRRQVLGWSGFPFVVLVLCFTLPALLPVWLLLLFITNFSVSRYYENKTLKADYFLHYLYRLVWVAEKMESSLNTSDIACVESLRANRGEIKKIRRTLKLVAISQNHDSILVSNFMYLVNLFFPYDWVVYSFSIDAVLAKFDVIRKAFLAIGELDTHVALASYLQRNGRLSHPEFNNDRILELQDAIHPLIVDCVPNTIRLYDKSALLTGSNMAGKSTFIKMVGVNFILARSFWICHANKAVLPMVDIYTSIKTEDNLEAGKSFYFSELERINLFLSKLESRSCLFIIDEIFRGTNTVERIAGAASVISALAKSNIVIVTSHDIELATILRDEIDMGYFEETGNLDKPFDYKLRAGVCETRNALKLMRGLGYPGRVVDRAVELSRKIERKSVVLDSGDTVE